MAKRTIVIITEIDDDHCEEEGWLRDLDVIKPRIQKELDVEYVVVLDIDECIIKDFMP